QCELAEQLYYSFQLHALQWIHLILAFASIILCVYTAQKYVNKSLFESSTKELIIALYFYCIVLSSMAGIAQIFHLISRYTASAPCDAQIPKRLCILRLVVTACIPGFCFTHIAITTQRLQSTFNVRSRWQKITARVFIVFYACGYGYIAFYREPMNGLSPFCTAFTHITQEVLNINLNLMVISATASAAATFVLWWFNNSRLKQERKEYKIKKTFHRKQCIYSIKQFLPVTIIHTITFVTQFGKTFLSRYEIKAFVAFLNTVMPYYCLLAPLTLLILIRRGRFERNAALRGHIAPERREAN
ncbi:hypothetical protein PMAYCL1PPCAC_27081, partial [Pristionchus mayeri]